MADTTATDNEVVDTSTNEESQATDDLEAAFEDGEGFETEETEETGSDDEELEATDESDDDEEESEEDDASDTSEAETEEAEGTEADDTAEAEETKDKPKSRNDENAQRRIAEREARDRENAVQRAREDERIKQYLKEAESDEAELKVRQAEVDRHLLVRERAAMNAERLEVAVDKAVGTIDLFKTADPEIKRSLGEAIDEFIASNVTVDEYGNAVEVRGDLYQHLLKKSDEIRRLTSLGARQRQTAKAKTKARTQTVPSKAPKEAKKDEGLDAFDEEAGRW